MASELMAGLGTFKTLLDMAKGLKDINDASVRNAAVLKLQDKILSAQEAQAALIQRIGELEKEVACYEEWESEKRRYALKDYGGGTFAYELKEEEANGEPPHKICASCYQNGHKSILQFQYVTDRKQERHICANCKTPFFLGEQTAPTPKLRRRRTSNWIGR